MYLHIFGILGGIIGISSQLPQLVQSWRTKSTRDISINTYLLLILNNCLWFTHGLVNHDPALYVANIIALIFPIGILVAKLKYK